MLYHLEFTAASGRRYTLDGTKYMQKNDSGPREVLSDYTTLYCRLQSDAGLAGSGVLKFRTFEDLAALGNLTAFLASFQVTGTNDPVVQLQARMRFLAFTGQFVEREYDPLALPMSAP